MSAIKQTPDLSTFNGSFPKPIKRTKIDKKIPIGKKTKHWNEGRKNLKLLFYKHNIKTCELKVENICIGNNYLGFAHIRRRFKLTTEEIIDHKKVVLACQPCHSFVDFTSNRKDAEDMLDAVVASRQF